MVHIVEATVGRRYAGWFIRNTEHTQRVLDGLKAGPLPNSKSPAKTNDATAIPSNAPAKTTQKVTWGKVSA